MERHITVLKEGDGSPKSHYCKNTTLYHCPFCPHTGAQQYMIDTYHMKNHASVKHREFTIIKCGLKCRSMSHFHCCYCTATILDRKQFVVHLKQHKEESRALKVEGLGQPTENSATSSSVKCEKHSTTLEAPGPQPDVEPPGQPTEVPGCPEVPHKHPEVPHKHPEVPHKHPEVPQKHPEVSGVSSEKAKGMAAAYPCHTQLTPLPEVLHKHPDVPNKHPDVQAPAQPTEILGRPDVPPKEHPVVKAPGQHPEALRPDPAVPRQHPEAQAAERPSEARTRHVAPPTPRHPLATELPKPPAVTVKGKPTKVMVTCPYCKRELNRNNYKVHLRRRHAEGSEPVSKDRFLASECIDVMNGVFAVEKFFSGPATPVHVVKNIQGSRCEVDLCRINYDSALKSGTSSFECEHVRSLSYGPLADDATDNAKITLTEEALVTMVQRKWFAEERKASLLRLQRQADDEGTPLSVRLAIGEPSKTYISVYEPKVNYYSRLGRVIVAFDSKWESWRCPCSKYRRSCTHEAIAKWHLFVTDGELFGRGDQEDYPPHYPPCDKDVEKMVKYLLEYKKLPARLPDEVVFQSRGKQPEDVFPTHLIPKEARCQECGDVLGEPILITAAGRILTITGVVEGISTYRKSCLNCSMVYRYQEWEDGLHNFDDHIIMSLLLCTFIRNALKFHTSVKRVIRPIEATARVSFPDPEKVLRAYLHFEALSEHDYMFACVTCGDSPAVVVMDRHKEIFNMPVSEIPSPPDDYDGHVDIQTFWDAVTTEMISHGLIPCGRENPFVVPPSYHHWAPWIGPHTRRSDVVLNTEFEKIKKPGASDDQEITEEQLVDEIMDLEGDALTELCEQCGLDGRAGCKLDLVLRLREDMSNRMTYNKVFQKVRDGTGGWAVITCPCGVVCSVKRLLRARSPRDYVDLLLSWKHFPNIAVYDDPQGLVSHASQRRPEIYHPFQGRLLEPTPDNITRASGGKLCVSMPWLKHSKVPGDRKGHPVTGSSQHFALSDEYGKDVLRSVELVPELAGRINSQCAEQLLSGMEENDYFLNRTTPSTHVFLQRNILHHYNVARNDTVKRQHRKNPPADVPPADVPMQ